MMEQIKVIVKVILKKKCTVFMEFWYVDSYFLHETLSLVANIGGQQSIVKERSGG